ncbi:pentatricopeptide repeat-containing protein At3g13160, mitochondrial-like [Vitis riparia]|uniref:pentatricopeptide repeat-containing protein At3g13160, mitochondrial-like n=1 Tax=Vitis riparia TaxID=96939 RepID=UPI00155AF9EC|nr:pentatricopeptide repeat-containing protein At3g13160, mitochondrial-like [Vitis riparia]
MSFLSRRLYRAFSTSTAATAQATGNLESVFKDIYRERNLKRLVQKFKKSSELDRFRTKTGIYEETVRRLASAKRFRWIEEILEEQKKYKDISREGFAVRLISLYGKSGMFDHAFKVFDEMPDQKCERSVLSFNALLGACVNSKKFDKVEGFFSELPSKLSVEPDLVSYNIVIKGLCDMGSMDSAVGMLDEMEKKSLEPDLITFNTLLNRYYTSGRFLDGEKIWGRMEKKNILPDIRSYNAKLVGLVSEKRMLEGIGLVEEMQTKGIKPDGYSFNALIKGFCNDGKVDEATNWYGKMRENDCSPDKLTFATLVPLYCEKGYFDQAFELCREIFNRKCLVDEVLLQNAVDGLVKGGKVVEAKKLVQLGNSNSYRRYNLKIPTDK